MSDILKIYKTLLCKLDVLKGSSSGISISAIGVITPHLKTVMEKNCQVAEKMRTICMNKKKTYLTMTRTIRLPFRVKSVKIVCHDFISSAEKFRTVKIRT